MAAIFELLESILISRSVLLDPEYVGVAAGISSLSCIQTDIFLMAHVLLVMAAVFDFPGHSCIEEYSVLLLDLKNGVICRKFSDILLESCNLIYIRGR